MEGLTPYGLTLREYGSIAVVPRVEWEASGLAEAAELLARRRVLTVRRSGSYYLLEPRQFVGNLRLSGRSIAVEPRLPRLFGAMRELVSRAPAKAVPVTNATRRDEAPHALHPAQAFAVALEDAVRDGLPSDYERVNVTTSRPKGRLLASDTQRTLHARGLHHLVRCAVTTRRYDPRLCRVVQAASLMLIAPRDVPLAAAVVIDRLAPLTEGDVVISVNEAKALVPELRAAFADRPPVVELLRVAAEVLAGADVIWSLNEPLAGGECWFCDMVSLWEHSIHAALTSVCGPTERATLHPLRRSSTLLFQDGGPDIDPDLAMYRGDTILAVVDAKYSIANIWTADDVYQIAAYARRTGAAIGALVYVAPGANWIQPIGRDGDGARIFAFGVSAEDGVAGLNAMATRLKAEIAVSAPN